MSTILDALRKLQRERTAESPSRDLRGSITTETPMTARRKRSGRSGWLAGVVLLLLLAGGAFWLQQSGRLSSWLHARGAPDTETSAATEAELAEAEREAANAPADVAPEAPAVALGEGSATALPTQPIAPPAEPSQLGPPEVDVAEAETPEVETPEIAAERVRLENAVANARAAQEAQDAAELAAAQKAAAAEQAARDAQAAKEAQEIAAAAAAAEAATKSAAAAAAPTPKAVAATATKPAPPATAAKAAPATKSTTTATGSTATAKPAARPARAPEPRYAAAGASRIPSTVFPDVRVESIRWHPIPERRIASLQFEQQSAPEAREGDIVAGVLVYRIDPGSVELRIGSAQRVISPEP